MDKSRDQTDAVPYVETEGQDDGERRETGGVSQMDARVTTVKLPSSTVDASNAWYYDMSKQGRAIVFNHYEYESDGVFVRVPKRTGTNFDTQRLKSALKALNFQVVVHNDLKQEEIERVLAEAAKLTRDDIGCLIVVVMTHGEMGLLRASDYEYGVDKLWDGFTSKACPALAGVPKLFFIQACRGDKVDEGQPLTMSDTVPQPRRDVKLPSMADILQMYSTYQDHASWREDDGSWFVQSLCEVLENEAGADWDLVQMLTFVNRKVALEYESYTYDPASNRMKQIPQVVSMLTKLLKFRRTSSSS